MAAMPPVVAERTDDRIDRVLRWGLFATVLIAMAVLAAGTLAVYQGAPPIPDRVVSATGATLYTRADIVAGKAVFHRTDLMDFGSLYGNGAYFGPDWTADYLHREATKMSDIFARMGGPYAFLPVAEQQQVTAQVTAELKANTLAAGVVTYSGIRAGVFAVIRDEYRNLFLNGDRALGLQPNTVRTATEADQLTAFLSWAAWTTVTNRPGETASYTNNWPYEPLVGNTATGAMWTWTWISLAALAIGAVVLVLFYRRFFAGAHLRVPATEPAAAEAATAAPDPAAEATPS